MGKDVNCIMDKKKRTRPVFPPDPALVREQMRVAGGDRSQASILNDAAAAERRLAAEALNSGQLLARSHHAARAEALVKARDRALRRLRGSNG